MRLISNYISITAAGNKYLTLICEIVYIEDSNIYYDEVYQDKYFDSLEEAKIYCDVKNLTIVNQEVLRKLSVEQFKQAHVIQNNPRKFSHKERKFVKG